MKKYLFILILLIIFITSCGPDPTPPPGPTPPTPESEFSISGETSPFEGTLEKYRIIYEDADLSKNVTWSVSDKQIAKIAKQNGTSCQLNILKAGSVILTATESETLRTRSITIMVQEPIYTIYYDLSEEDHSYLPDSVKTSFKLSELPIELPILEGKENYYFKGWHLDGSVELYSSIPADYEPNEEVRLIPEWSYPQIKSGFEEYQFIEKNNQLKIVLDYIDFPSYLLNEELSYKSSDENILTVDDNGIISAKNIGSAYVKVTMKNYPNINTIIGINVVDDLSSLTSADKAIIKAMNQNVKYQYIMVYGWQNYYQYDLIGSVCNYLFEDFEVIENIAPLTIDARPGTKKEKYYICVHDTGDALYSAYEWSETVKRGADIYSGDKYEASFQYVVGNDGIYHNIPDDEVAWHAGDGTRVDYALDATGVYGEDQYPTITISLDGYYEINGKKTLILAPKKDNGDILTTESINDVGIRCVIKDGQYYLGKTHYDSTYKRIANYGGNNNSIGIESCINVGSDVYYTWQKLAKLVANLMDQNNLTINDVVPHHYFSGKNCPMTIRESDNWNYFLHLVETEYEILQFIKEGYTFKLIKTSDLINEVGRTTSIASNNFIQEVTVEVSKDSSSHKFTFYIAVPEENFVKSQK